jgi:hypothetical protein
MARPNPLQEDIMAKARKQTERKLTNLKARKPGSTRGGQMQCDAVRGGTGVKPADPRQGFKATFEDVLISS